jgi:hypothetical protein
MDKRIDMKPIIRKGAAAVVTETTSGQFISIREGEQLEFAMLTDLNEVISFDQHVFWGDEPSQTVMFPCLQVKSCPGCLLGNKSRLRALLLVAYKNGDGQIVPGILPVGLSVVRSLVDLDAAIDGGIKGAQMLLKRTGSGLKTRYTLLATGGRMKKQIDTSSIDLEAAVGETDRAAIIQMLEEAGHDTAPVKMYDASSAAAASPKQPLGKHGSQPAPTASVSRTAEPENVVDENEPVTGSQEDKEGQDDWA